MAMDYSLNVRILSGKEVAGLLDIQDVMDVVEETFCALGRGAVFHPVKEPMWLNDNKTNMLIAMPAFLSERKLAGVKWVNMFKEQQPGFPTVGGTILVLNSSENGQPYAIMEATPITTMRTAGGHGAIAAKYLAKKNSKRLSIIGCGNEARSGVDALLRLFSLNEILVYDLSTSAMQNFGDYVGDRCVVKKCSSAKEAVSECDIVFTVTTSRKPVVMFDWLKKGCTVLGMYSLYDLDPACAKRADKWVLGSKFTDNHQIVFDPLLKDHELSMDNVYADLCEIVTGKLPARESDEEIIVFTCLGMGALDTAVGEIVYKRAVEKGIGTVLNLA